MEREGLVGPEISFERKRQQALRCVGSRGVRALPSCQEGRWVLIPTSLSLHTACGNNWEGAQLLLEGPG